MIYYIVIMMKKIIIVVEYMDIAPISEKSLYIAMTCSVQIPHNQALSLQQSWNQHIQK